VAVCEINRASESQRNHVTLRTDRRRNVTSTNQLTYQRRFSDAYHTCYVLSGLSSAQHKWTLASIRAGEGLSETDKWAASSYHEGVQIFDEEDRVGPVHPVYVIPQNKVEAAQLYFRGKAGF
jgi:hypothetical protein